MVRTIDAFVACHIFDEWPLCAACSKLSEKFSYFLFSFSVFQLWDDSSFLIISFSLEVVYICDAYITFRSVHVLDCRDPEVCLLFHLKTFLWILVHMSASMIFIQQSTVVNRLIQYLTTLHSDNTGKK